MIRPGSLSTEKESVTLRRLDIEDATAYFKTIDNGREHLGRFGEIISEKYPNLQSVEESILVPDPPDKWRLGIWDDETLVGSINLTPRPRGEAEIGYWVGAEYVGHGYATTATRALTQFARDKFSNLKAKVRQDNVASKKTLIRSGFVTFSRVHADQGVFELLRFDHTEATNALDTSTV